MSEFSQIRYESADHVATITLHRPDRLNAFTTTMARELVAAFDAADADDDVRVVLMTGAGRAFCAGADLGRGASTFDATDPVRAAERAGFETIGGVPRDGGGTVSLRIAASRKPVIVAVNGPAVGVGATMTLPADVRIAGQSARFGFVFARRGLVPEAASSWFLPRVVGISQAMEWVATGRVFDAAEALGGRLVSRVLPDNELLPAARALAAEIAENTSAVSVALARQLMWSMLGTATRGRRTGSTRSPCSGSGRARMSWRASPRSWRNARRSSPAGSLISPVSSRCGRSGRRPWTERH